MDAPRQPPPPEPSPSEPPRPPPLPASEVAVARPVEYGHARPINPLELRQLTWREAALDGGLVLTVTVLANYLPEAIVAPFLPPGPPPLLGQGWIIAVAKGVELLVVLVVAGYLIHRAGLSARCFGWRTDGLLVQLLWVPAILAGLYAYMLLTALALIPVLAQPEVAQEEIRTRMEFFGGLPDDPLMLAALFGIVGLQEELVFRGLLLTYGRRLLGSWAASIAACAVLFGLLHVPGQGLMAALQITGVGIVLSLFFIATRSLLAVAIAHALFNFLQTQAVKFIPAFQEALRAATQPS